MVFGMISASGTEILARLHAKINATVYKEILKKHIVPNLRTVINQLALFMQNNALCYTAKSVIAIKWPAQSPVINPMGSVWKLLNERAKEKNRRTNLKGEWEKISVDQCKILIGTCCKRCQGVIETKRSIHQILMNYERYFHLDMMYPL